MAGAGCAAIGFYAGGVYDSGFYGSGFYASGLAPFQMTAVVIAGGVGGLLPDLDSDTGKPLAFMFHFISVLIPSLLFPHVSRLWGTSPEFVVSWFSIAYILIRYVGCALVKKMTIHRGIMHSVPFAVLGAELGYLFFLPSGQPLSILCGGAIFAGCLLHLLMDEMNSFTLKFGCVPVLRRSTGTAMKLRSDSLAATLFVYGWVAALLYLILFGFQTWPTPLNISP